MPGQLACERFSSAAFLIVLDQSRVGAFFLAAFAEAAFAEAAFADDFFLLAVVVFFAVGMVPKVLSKDMTCGVQTT